MQAAVDTRKFLRPVETRAILGVSEVTLRKLTDRGYLRVYRVPGIARHRRFLDSEVRALLDSMMGTSEPHFDLDLQ